ncbi:M2 family metallopeptidase [Endozoicomonas ascidiicola]|nr:M2 family metallopeptidase [Endozoicomonas ascidiicola]
METGTSLPWQEIYADFTEKEVFDASAMLEYFVPLQAYLDEQNQGLPWGW